MIKVRKLDGSGHTDYELCFAEAQKMVNEETEKYFTVNAQTKQIINRIKDGQELLLIPRIQGG